MPHTTVFSPYLPDTRNSKDIELHIRIQVATDSIWANSTVISSKFYPANFRPGKDEPIILAADTPYSPWMTARSLAGTVRHLLGAVRTEALSEEIWIERCEVVAQGLYEYFGSSTTDLVKFILNGMPEFNPEKVLKHRQIENKLIANIFRLSTSEMDFTL